MKRILILAAIIYSIIAPLTYHPDTKLTLYYASLNNGRVWDIYTYLHNNPDNFPKFHYPPMHFWALKVEWPMVRLIGGPQIEEWLKTGSNVAFTDKNIFIYNLASKLPILLLVLLSGYIIGRILIKNGYKAGTAKMAMAIWLFNPVTIYAAVMMGQNDILAIFPFLLGLLFYFDNPLLGFLLFGVGGSIKSYPLIWAIGLAAAYPTKNWFKKIGLAIVPVGFYVLTMLPFLGLSYFKQDVLYSGLSERMFEAAIDIGFGDKVLIVPLLLTTAIALGIKNSWGKDFKKISIYVATMSLVILGFSHFHPQWLMWLCPFVAMSVAMGEEWISWSWLVPAWIIVILLFGDLFLYWGILAPMNPNLMNMPFINELLVSRGIQTNLLNNLAHSLIAGTAVYWLLRLNNEK